MLEKVGFENFLSLRDVKIDLEPFTVFVGPNASGKSTILEGIKKVSSYNIAQPALSDFGSLRVLQNFDEVLFRTAKQPQISFQVKFNERTAKVRLEREEEVARYLHEGNEISFNVRKISFSQHEAVKSSYPQNPAAHPYLEENGAGLATIFSDIQGAKEEKLELIQEKMRQIIPNLQKIRIKFVSVPATDWFNVFDEQQHLQDVFHQRTGRGQELRFDFINALDIPASRVSEGTLFALTVLVAVASSEGATAILIDDIERGLHPKAVKDLIRVLREIQKITPDLQIIATSHSPYVLHELEPKEVRVVAFDPELGTLVAPLEDYPEFEKWRKEMTPGEFWSFVGEDWVKDLAQQKVQT